MECEGGLLQKRDKLPREMRNGHFSVITLPCTESVVRLRQVIYCLLSQFDLLLHIINWCPFQDLPGPG